MRSFAIIPAAGHSRRMGQPKLLMPWGDSTVIGQVLASWQSSRITEIVVVIRPDDDRLADQCRGLADVVRPAAPPPDMKASVLLGIEHLRQTAQPNAEDVWLLAPADLPHISPNVINQLLEEYDPGFPRITAPAYAGRRGHPVLFPWALAEEVAGLGAQEGVNALLQRHAIELIDCQDATILEDVDTPEDYARLQKRHKAN